MKTSFDPADLLEESFYDSTLSDLERRHSLERTGRVAAGIQIDLEDGGPLALYISSRRHEAAEALRILVAIDPKDAVAVALAQATVGEYLRACDWIRAHMEAAAQAEQIIKREYDDHPQDPE